jgi:hypothetical protein
VRPDRIAFSDHVQIVSGEEALRLSFLEHGRDHINVLKVASGFGTCADHIVDLGNCDRQSTAKAAVRQPFRRAVASDDNIGGHLRADSWLLPHSLVLRATAGFYLRGA